MIIFPSIDIKDSMVVRLRKGDFATAHKVADDPFETVSQFKAAGADHLHMVDLDGARGGVRLNHDLLLRLAREFGGFVQIGGGIRSMADVSDYLENGISRVILGSAAFRDRDFLRAASVAYPGRVAVGIDARDGMVSLAGWTEDTAERYDDFAAHCAAAGIKNFIFTDIGRDGMLMGPNFEQLEHLKNRLPDIDITASGGVTTLGDIQRLAAMGLYGAICGKALYTGDLDLGEAIEAGRIG